NVAEVAERDGEVRAGVLNGREDRRGVAVLTPVSRGCEGEGLSRPGCWRRPGRCRCGCSCWRRSGCPAAATTPTDPQLQTVCGVFFGVELVPVGVCRSLIECQ